MRQLRKDAGIGLRQLARRLNLSAPYLCDIELNRRRATGKLVIAYMRLR